MTVRSDSFDRALLAERPGLLRYAMKLTRNSAAAEDLTQTVLLKAISKCDQFRDGTSLPAWVRTIALNQFLTDVRRKREVEDVDGESAARMPSAERQSSTTELRDVLVQIESLPPTQRRAINLVGMQGLSYDEAATELGAPIGTIKSAVFRARAFLNHSGGAGPSAVVPFRPPPQPRPQAVTSAAGPRRTPKMTEDGLRDPGEPPVLDWLDKTLIDVDPAYQRELDEARVLRMLEWFEWKAFGAIVVAKAEDGRYHVTDGQHRLEAAKRHPAIDVVPAVIIEAEGTSGEAENFVAINKDRRNVTPLQLYWAELAAGDPEAQTVAQVCERAGVTIVRYPGPGYRVGDTVAISAIRRLVDARGAMRAREVLEIVAKAALAPIRGEFIRAAEIIRFDAEFADQVDDDALSDSLSGSDEEIGAEAKAFAKTHRLGAAKALASVWFRRTRKRRRAA